MSRPITFVQLTDLHIGNPEVEDPRLFSDTTSTLRENLAQIRAMTPPPEFVIVSGDLTNRGDAGSYRHLRGLLEEAALEMPLILAIGNHDTREGFYRAMLGRDQELDAPYMHDLVVSGVHVLVLDSTTPGLPGGSIEPEQFDWLEQRLAAHPALPKLIVTHHGPHLDETDDSTAWEAIDTEASLRLRDLLQGQPVLGILSGHIHLDRATSWYGIPLFVTIGHHTALDYFYDGLRAVTGASMAVGTIRPSGLTMAYIPRPSERKLCFEIPRAEMPARLGGKR